MCLDLLLFSDSLLILSYSTILSSSFITDSALLFWTLSLKVSIVLNKVVSTAYIIKLNIWLACEKSFIYI